MTGKEFILFLSATVMVREVEAADRFGGGGGEDARALRLVEPRLDRLPLRADGSSSCSRMDSSFSCNKRGRVKRMSSRKAGMAQFNLSPFFLG